MANDARTPRREFLRRTGASALVGGAGFAFPTIVSRHVLGRGDVPPPSERIRVGLVGVGAQGKSNLKNIQKQKNAEVVAVSDVDKVRLAEAAKLAPAPGKTVQAEGDYRRLLDNKGIDAILVSTPDHWHALVSVDACAAGKDVYCEKPLGLTVADGQAMVEAARKHGRIFQTGSQQRSDARFRLACELVRSGRLGKIQSVKVNLPKVNFAGPAVANTLPPAELDYLSWLGPAPEKPYNPKHVHYNFRFFWDYAGGQMTNFGAHDLDIAQWGLGRDESGPVAVEATAHYQKDGWYDVPESSVVVFTYDDGIKITCDQGGKGGPNVTFVGEKGSISVTRSKIESNPPEIIQQPLESKDVHLYVSTSHHANWLECIKTRALPICDVAIGHRSATLCHLGNIACRVGRKLAWDPKAETIVGDPDAARMLVRPYRSPYHLPVSMDRKTAASRI